MKVYGVTGLPGSGKSIISRIAKKENIHTISMGDVIRKEAELNNCSTAQAAVNLRKKYGNNVVADRCVKHIQNHAKNHRFKKKAQVKKIHNKNKNKGFNKGILVYGHEHIPYIEKKDNMIYINVGSISLPRDGNDPTYMIYENKEFTIYDIYWNIVSNIRI